MNAGSSRIVVADAQLPGLERLAEYCQLRAVAAADFTPAVIADADALLVRSVTPVNRTLLANSTVSFVGAASSGTDHIDLDYLRSAEIAFADAAGSNAQAVADYCLTVLAWHCQRQGLQPQSLTVGIVGHGHVGSALAQRLDVAGLSIRLCDPPQAELDSDTDYVELAALADCDVVSLHVPLTASGKDATLGLIDTDFLASMVPGSLLINASRGGVVDESALSEALRNQRLHAALDVWRNEPTPDLALLQQVDLATPHIAGYGVRAKGQAALAVMNAMLAHFCLSGLPPFAAQNPPLLSAADLPSAEADASVWGLLPRMLPLSELSTEFKALVAGGQGGAGFERLRRSMLKRLEFGDYRLAPELAGTDLAEQLRALGFGTY